MPKEGFLYSFQYHFYTTVYNYDFQSDVIK